MTKESTEQLVALAHNQALECGEIVTKDRLISLAIELEKDEGLEFTPRDLVIAYYQSNEAAIDSFVENAAVTPDSEWSAEDKADYIEEMESKRPTNLRKQALDDALADL